jgi:hypothetical protein
LCAANSRIHAASTGPALSGRRRTDVAPTTSSRRRYRLPCLEIGPSRWRPPVECSRGVSPSQEANARPFLKADASAIRPAKAEAPIGPTQG